MLTAPITVQMVKWKLLYILLWSVSPSAVFLIPVVLLSVGILQPWEFAIALGCSVLAGWALADELMDRVCSRSRLPRLF